MIARVALVLVFLATAARADDAKVALLPLDAGAKLEVYGQVVASELAQALIAGKIDVVVVLPKMAVPDEAKLIVDGKIAGAKNGAIELSIRVRKPNSPAIVRQLSSTASSLETLDKTTKDLAAQVLPVIRGELAALALAAQPEPVKPEVPVVPRRPPARPLLVGIGAKPAAEPLRAALADAVPGWASAASRAPSVIEAGMLGAKTAAKTVAGSNADRGIAFEVLGYRQWGKEVPLAKARVRVRIADAGQVLFDRVVVTDTIVGDKAMPADQLAARVAREVLSILRPHVRKAVPAWP